VLPRSLSPGSLLHATLATASLTSLVTSLVVAFKSAWTAFGYSSVFGDDDESEEARKSLIMGVDVTGLVVLEEPEFLRALQFAQQSHEGQYRRSGEPYVVHPVETARIVAALVPPRSDRSRVAVMAAVLHDVVSDTSATLEEVEQAFGREVAEIVDGVTRLSTMNQLVRRHRRLEALGDDDGQTDAWGKELRSLILEIVADPRVLLVKLADRLHNMRTLHALSPDRAMSVATETLGVWCSLAERLGCWTLKSELEDLCFAVIEPQRFLSLKVQLDSVWAGQPACSEAESLEMGEAFLQSLLAETPSQPGDEQLSTEQLRMRALLGCVLPFDLLTQRSPTAAASRAPASAAAALSSLASCQRALRDELRLSGAASGLDVQVSGRLKTLYSTHNKMLRKRCSVEAVYDARALRIVLDDGFSNPGASSDTPESVVACYALLALIHKLWRPIAKELDDYFVRPKASGYQSLHTAVRTPDGSALEIQIRTRRTHEFAEFGAAAHWRYKDASDASPLSPAPSTPQEPAEPSAEPLASPHFPPAGSHVGTQPGSPLLRICAGRLNDAAVVSVDETRQRMLVAVKVGARFGEAEGVWPCAADYESLVARVAEQGWHEPGQGDWSVCLEQVVLCTDGRWHKVDAFGRHMESTVELLPNAATEALPRDTQPPSSWVEDSGQGDKVRLLRELLSWETELFPSASRGDESVSCVLLPEIRSISMQRGTTLRAVARTHAPLSRRAVVNSLAVDLDTVLKDGDVVQFE
jgi:ppGpp synthetase/RelA/SpoT-type nucleotidyltranferase